MPVKTSSHTIGINQSNRNTEKGAVYPECCTKYSWNQCFTVMLLSIFTLYYEEEQTLKDFSFPVTSNNNMSTWFINLQLSLYHGIVSAHGNTHVFMVLLMNRTFLKFSKTAENTRSLKTKHVYISFPYILVNSVVNIIAQKPVSGTHILFPFLRDYHRVTHFDTCDFCGPA